jgi:demethylmenaquinone methyltransferase/2-methoxy-6-polyprenyl-1,4-benzoquinol methylase
MQGNALRLPFTRQRTLPEYSAMQDTFIQVGLEQTAYYPLTGGIAAVHLGIKKML